MKKNLFIIFLVCCCLLGITAGLYYHSRIAQIYSHTQQITSTPIILDIPRIHVHAAIESVGLDSHHNMGVPANPNDVAWYNLGPQPGQIGNAVIDGHVDTPTGAAAVFAQLKNLQPGDTIDVTEKQHVTHEFIVTSVEDLPTAAFPVNRIFGPTSGSHLNLITCDGVWDTNANNYTQRLVVFSNMMK